MSASKELYMAHNIKLTFLPFLLPATTWSHSPVVAGMSHHSCMEWSVSLCGFWWSHRSRATLQSPSCTQSPVPWARWALPRSTTSDRCHLRCWSACCWQGRTCYWKWYRETQRTALSPGKKKTMAIIIVMIVKTHYYANILCFWVYSFIFHYLPHLMGLHLKCSWTKPVYAFFPCLLEGFTTYASLRYYPFTLTGNRK